MENKPFKEKERAFEVLDVDKKRVVFKRILPSKGRSAKETRKLELQQPKVVLHFFDENDLKSLNAIEVKISEAYQKPKEGGLSKIMRHFVASDI